MSTATRLLTIDEFLALPEVQAGGEKFELVEGEVINLGNALLPHEILKSLCNEILAGYCSQHREWLLMPESMWILNSRNGYVPDLSIAPRQRVFQRVAHGRADFPPVLAVEIVSSASARVLTRKIAVYLAEGCQTIWVMYPKQSRVEAHTKHGVRHYTAQDVLTDAALPGLEIRLSDLFDALTSSAE